ncbi:GNAT family N-acetyltransferase [Caproicibacter sp.]|uniref:GNAT family N-acetyltransferase n=1 Tax=Caproicibacter sp. TaxID=2814884 RepID=UPI0039894866
MISDSLSRDKSACFESDRLLYRGITWKDAAQIVEWRSNGQIIRFFRSKIPLTMETHLAWFEKYRDDATRFDFMITEKATGRKIGIAGLQNLYGKSADVSYFIDPPSQGRGFGTEAIRAISAYGFEHFRLQSLNAVILVGNSASQKAAERAGFQLYSRIYRLEKPEENQ